MDTTELIIGLVGLTVILGMFVGSLLVAFVLPPRVYAHQRKRRYPVVVPRYGMRLNSLPPTEGGLDTLVLGLDYLVKFAVAAGYEKRPVLKKLAGLNVRWLKAEGDKRFVVDSYGRKIAGDHSGDDVRVVWIPNDDLADTAFFHECGHELQELKGIIDYDHKDEVMWRDIVFWTKKASR